MHSISLHKALLDKTGVVWITCGLLWCFYKLFGLSFWRHPFTMEDPLRSKWCNATFLQKCSDQATNSSTSWKAWGWVCLHSIPLNSHLGCVACGDWCSFLACILSAFWYGWQRSAFNFSVITQKAFTLLYWCITTSAYQKCLWNPMISLYLTTDFAPLFVGWGGSWFSLDETFFFNASETALPIFLAWVTAVFSVSITPRTGFRARGRPNFSGTDFWFCSGPGLRSSSKAVLWRGFPAKDSKSWI